MKLTRHNGRTGKNGVYNPEQVYRGMQSLCAKGAGSGEHSARVKGQSSWQVKGGSHCPVKRRFVT